MRQTSGSFARGAQNRGLNREPSLKGILPGAHDPQTSNSRNVRTLKSSYLIGGGEQNQSLNMQNMKKIGLENGQQISSKLKQTILQK